MLNFKSAIRVNQANKQGKCNVKIRVSHQRKTRYIPTAIFLEPVFFDNNTGKVKKNHANAAFINIELQKIILNYEQTALSLPLNIDIQKLIEILKAPPEADPDFFQFAEKRRFELLSLGKNSSADLIRYTLTALKAFTNRSQLTFKEIDFKFLSDFDFYLKKKGLKTNAISVYFRNIRTLFNLAIDNAAISLNLYPFRRFKIHSEPTKKRNLTIKELKQLKKADLKGHEKQARDLFLLSFYLIGINLKDLFYLKELKNGRIFYTRAKTKRLYSVKVLPAAIEIINQYHGKKYLLNISDQYSNPDNFKKSFNKFLKRVSKKLSFAEPITSYYARHSWATIAAGLDIPKETISAALGHNTGSETTAIYIDFDLKKVDLANEKVFNFVNQK
jgi:integrase